MSTLPKPLQAREELLKRNVRVFTAEEFGRIFQAPAYSIKYFLEKQTNQGLFLRLKKGVYVLKTDFPSEEEIANVLYKPSYISFEYALAYYGMLPEMSYEITSATTKSTRSIVTSNTSFSYYTIKQEAYTGYSLVKTETKAFLIADREKALADYLYFVSIGKRSLNDRLILKDIDKNKLLKFGELFKRKKLINIIKDIC
jgi:predicted transcriptional regulator of viral defense system